ncbi:hypothetical protein PVNG_06333, partial [Plasmodium vivax North Korean]
NEFYLNCAFKYISSQPEKLYNIDASYIKEINKIEDPILRHIFIYFVHYYINGYIYFKDSKQHFRNQACQHLNRWLEGKKDLFTYGEICQKKLKLWKKETDTLWEILKKKHTLPNTEGKPWCDKSLISLKTEYPQGLTSFNCDKSISQETSSTNFPPPPVQTPSSCPPCPFSFISPETVTPSDTVSPPETDRTKNLAVTSGFTAAGTLATLFFLYRFTPMMSWFRRPGMNNVGTDLYMGTGAADNFLSMQHGNDSNNIFYQP